MSNVNYGYGVTQDTQDLSTGGTVIPPGINEDVTFVSAELGHLTDDTSKPKVLMINYEKNGLELRDVIWPVNPEREKSYAEGSPRQSKISIPDIGLKKGDIISGDQAVKIAFMDFNRKIKHILKAFLKDDRAAETGNVGSYEELATIFSGKLKPFFGKKVRLKVTLNKDDYAEIPKYGAFLEYDVPKEESQLKLGDRDRIERSTPTTETASENGTATSSSGTTAPPPPKTQAPPAAPAPAAPTPSA